MKRSLAQTASSAENSTDIYLPKVRFANSNPYSIHTNLCVWVGLE